MFLKNKEIIKEIFRLAIPITIASLLQVGYQLTDAFWVGKIGSDAVASVTVSFPITFLLISLGAGFSIAGSTLISQYVGAKDEKMVSHTASQTILIVSFISIVLGFIGFILAPSILHLMKVEQKVFLGALGFMRISFIGLVFAFIFIMFQSIMRGIGKVFLPMYIILGTLFLNFILDPLFIYGFGPVEGFGVSGTAFATLITQMMSALIGLIILFRGKHGIKLNVYDFIPDFSFIKKIFFLGVPASVEQVSRSLSLTVMTFLVSGFGTVALASYGIGSNVLQVVIIPTLGLSLSVSTLVGQNLGAKNIDKAVLISRLGIYISFFVLLIVSFLIYIFAPNIVSFFIKNDIETINVSVQFIHVITTSFVFMGLQMSMLSVIRASGDMITTMMMTIISQWVLQIPIAYFLSKFTMLEFRGIWFSMVLSGILATFITYVFYKKGKWKSKNITNSEKRLNKESGEMFREEVVNV
jgi:putative MATE family efflux protein